MVVLLVGLQTGWMIQIFGTYLGFILMFVGVCQVCLIVSPPPAAPRVLKPPSVTSVTGLTPCGDRRPCSTTKL